MSTRQLIFVITCLYLDNLVIEGLFDEIGCFVVAALIVPAANVEEVLVVALCLAFLGLMLFAEVSAAALFAMQGVVSYELAHEDEVAQMDGLVELDVEAFLASRNEEVGVELLTQSLEQLQAFLQAFLRATHTDVLPHDVAKFLVDGVNRALALDVHQTVNLLLNSLLRLSEFRQVGRETRPNGLVCEVVLYGVRQYEVSVGEALHESRCAEAVGSVVGEVALADGKEARNKPSRLD